MTPRELALAWLDIEPDAENRVELQGLLAGPDEAVADRFQGRLTFGTAGLRGAMGVGPLRMNRPVVRQAARGLMAYAGRGATVVIGYDARPNSDLFARDTAAVVAASGGTAFLFDQMTPTPVLAHAVRLLDADLGVMVTASHNPPGDNGYKVFLSDGAQLVPPIDREIENHIASFDVAGTFADGLDAEGEPDPDTGAPSGSIVSVGAGVIADYGHRVLPDVDLSGLTVAYTALHGVGGELFAAAARERGAVVHVVEQQHAPDGSFPTVAFPNPEEPGALDLVLDLATEVGADVALAHDPDADRLAVALPDVRDWRALTGNQLGALLADHCLAMTDGEDRLVVTTVVSSRLLGAQAAAAGVRFAETLTGFKWVMRPGIEDPTAHFVFGYEEALGYAVNDVVRDKDGVSAGLVFLAAMQRLRDTGGPLARLGELARAHGLHLTGQRTVRFGNPLAADAMAAVMAALRATPPGGLHGSDVVEITDYLDRPAPESTDLLRFDLADGTRVQIRPSGTEPKLKAYVEVIEPVDGVLGEASGRARVRLDGMLGAVGALLDDVRSGLGDGFSRSR